MTCALADHVTSFEKYCSSMAAMHTAESNTAAAENHMEPMLTRSDTVCVRNPPDQFTLAWEDICRSI